MAYSTFIQLQLLKLNIGYKSSVHLKERFPHISKLGSETVDDPSHVGCDAVVGVSCSRCFLRITVPSSSGSSSLILKMKALRFLEKSGTIHAATQHHIQEDLNLQQRHGEIPKSCTVNQLLPSESIYLRTRNRGITVRGNKNKIPQ